MTGHVMGHVVRYEWKIHSTGRCQRSVLREEWVLQSYIDQCKEHTKAEFNNLEIHDAVIFESEVYVLGGIPEWYDQNEIWVLKLSILCTQRGRRGLSHAG
jgi:hypothetical protein